MIIFDGFKLIGLAIMIAPPLILAIIYVIDCIGCFVKKGQQKRIDESFKE